MQPEDDYSSFKPEESFDSISQKKDTKNETKKKEASPKKKVTKNEEKKHDHDCNDHVDLDKLKNVVPLKKEMVRGESSSSNNKLRLEV